MTTDDWAYVKRLALDAGHTVTALKIKRSMRFGQAVDWILAAEEQSRTGGH